MASGMNILSIPELAKVEKKNAKVEKKNFCPFAGECREDCMLYSSPTGQCAFAVIAIRLDALVEGVPIVRLFNENEA